jgi:hypothetical protein
MGSKMKVKRKRRVKRLGARVDLRKVPFKRGTTIQPEPFNQMHKDIELLKREVFGAEATRP